MSDEKGIYCGCKKVPKNKEKGSMEECAEMGKVGLYGIHKIDKRVLESVGPESKKNKLRLLEKKLFKVSDEFKREKRLYNAMKEGDEKSRYRDKVLKLQKKLKKLIDKRLVLQGKKKVEEKKKVEKKKKKEESEEEEEEEDGIPKDKYKCKLCNVILLKKTKYRHEQTKKHKTNLKEADESD